jgi:hypothetical protein
VSVAINVKGADLDDQNKPAGLIQIYDLGNSLAYDLSCRQGSSGMVLHCQMKERIYLVHLKEQLGVTSIVAASVEIYSEHLVFVNPRGELVALFLMELVDHWSDCDE